MTVVLAPTVVRGDPFVLTPDFVSESREPAEIQGWRVRVGDDLRWSEPDHPDRSWPDGPSIFRGSPTKESFDDAAWFRTTVDVPPELVQTDIWLSVEHIGSVEVFVDGYRVLRRGRVQEALLGAETAVGQDLDSPVAIRFQRPGHHVIAVRFASTWAERMDRIGFPSGFRLYVGSEASFRDYTRNYNAGLSIHVWFAGAAFSFALLHFFLFWFRKSHRENFHFAMSGLCLGVLGFCVKQSLVAETAVTQFALFTFFKVVLVWASYAFLRFLQELLFSARPARRLLYIAAGVVLSLGAPWIHVHAHYIYSLVLLGDSTSVLALGLMTRQHGAALVAFGGACAAVGAGLQMIPPLLGYIPYSGLYVFGFTMNFIVISFLLAKNYARAQAELADQMALAIEQERRVREEEVARKSLEARNAQQVVLLDEAKKREQVLAQLEIANRELKSTQAQLVQSGKMAALGQLVAGVAHEINTPTGAIQSMHGSLVKAVGLLKSELGAHATELLEPGQKVHKSIKVLDDAAGVIGSASERVTEIVRRLRTFARLDEAEFKLVDINDGLRDTLMLVHHRVKHGLEIVTELGELPRIPCFPSQLNQVFLNLLVNAVQAIEGKGQITVRTRASKDAVVVEIEDTGVGIPPENLEKIFDPGFTTKGVRVGTGLGLSISFQIVQEHRGDIRVESTVGKGTKFTISIPRDLDEKLGRRPDA
ncbi:MAG: hypothetical protein HC923_00635 [Myxococcales bacterium]|nr:hypothetical protein [Myxococcales bacterium]